MQDIKSCSFIFIYKNNLIVFLKDFNIISMKNNYYPAVLIIISFIILSCCTEEKQLYGTWESILIENNSPLFSKTLPSSVKGEVVLELTKDRKFTWINKNEKLNLSGKYIPVENKIIFSIEGEIKPLEVEFRLQNDKLIIITEDEFKFSFIKND